MEFLKAILGEDLYKQFESKINSYNADSVNKDKQIKLVDLGSGEYVSKSKFDSLEMELNNTKTTLQTANSTIDDLKKNNTDNATLQQKIQEHEDTIKNMEKSHKEELSKMKKESAVKESLKNAKHSSLLLREFDLDKITLNDDGTMTGLNEQLEKIKEDYKDLFEEPKGDKDFKGVISHNAQGKDKPDITASQGTNYAKMMNESGKVTESKFFN